MTADETSEIATYKEENVFGQIREAYHLLWAKIYNFLPSKYALDESLNPSMLNNTAGDSSSSIKLPRLDIPKFSGDYDQWKTFYNLFMSVVHEDKNI